MGIYRANEEDHVEVSTIIGGEEVRLKFGKAPVETTDEALDQILSALADDPRNSIRRGGKPKSGNVRHVEPESEE